MSTSYGASIALHIVLILILAAIVIAGPKEKTKAAIVRAREQPREQRCERSVEPRAALLDPLGRRVDATMIEELVEDQVQLRARLLVDPGDGLIARQVKAAGDPAP